MFSSFIPFLFDWIIFLSSPQKVKAIANIYPSTKISTSFFIILYSGQIFQLYQTNCKKTFEIYVYIQTVNSIPWRCLSVFSFLLWSNVFREKVRQNKNNTAKIIVDHQNGICEEEISQNIQVIMYILLFLITTFFFPLFSCECFL